MSSTIASFLIRDGMQSDISPARPDRPDDSDRPLSPSSNTLAPNNASTDDSAGADGYFGDSSTFAFVSKVQPDTQNLPGVHLQHGQPSGSPSTTAPGCHDEGGQDTVYSMRTQLPDRHLADNLVDVYFNRFHLIYPFLHESSFRAEYENMWADPEQAPRRSSWHALLNAVFTLGYEFYNELASSDVPAAVPPFSDRARTIILAQVYKRGNLELMQGLLLLCHYLQGTLDLNECWNLVGLMIRTAFSIGLHLNPDSLSVSSVEKEVRKRVWWGCFALDRTVSMKFGRPPSLHLQDALAVPYPLPVDDQYIQNDIQAPRQPSYLPSTTEFFIHTIKLARLIDDILRHLYSAHRGPSRSESTDPLVPEQELEIAELIILDGRLRSWWNTKPAHLVPESPTWASTVFQRQQTVMQIRYKQIQILLRRPLLLMFSRDDPDDDFVRAIAVAGSQMCLAAARQTIRMIHEQYHRQLLNPLWYNLHYIFTSMGVLLHVRNMDKSKAEVIEPEQRGETVDALDCGMDFLKKASQISPLAARYVKMLQYIRDVVDQGTARPSRKDGSKLSGGGGGGSVLYPNYAALAQGQELWPDLASWQTQRFLTEEEIDLNGVDLESFFLGN
ncbi:Fungal specific transcription factor domain-containing protein [Cladophialophora immunda]|nr:Fungal specific transcription factor domain-containing protein [Cladophialophora immunda]